MNKTIPTPVTLAAIPVGSPARAQNSPVKEPGPPPPITPKDVRVLPYSREHEKPSLDGKRGYPDELRVVTTANKIHLYGTKRAQKETWEGRLICHCGKLALLAPVPRKGKVSVKVPPADDVTYYYAVLEMTDGALESKELKVEPRKDYSWAFSTEAGESTFVVLDGQTQLARIKAPAEKVKGYGFSSTVRWKGNEADLTFTAE